MHLQSRCGEEIFGCNLDIRYFSIMTLKRMYVFEIKILQTGNK